MCLTREVLVHADLQQGKTRQRVWQPRPAVVVGERFLAPHLQMKVSLGIAGEQAQMGMRDRMTIHSIENANGDGFVVDDREVLIRAAHLTRVKGKWTG